MPVTSGSVISDSVTGDESGVGEGAGPSVSLRAGVSDGEGVGEGETAGRGVGGGAGLFEQEADRSSVIKTKNATQMRCVGFQGRTDSDFKLVLSGICLWAFGVIQAGMQGELAAGLRAADVHGDDVFALHGFDDVDGSNFFTVRAGQGDVDVWAFAEGGDFDIDASPQWAVIVDGFGAQFEEAHFLGRDGDVFPIVGEFGEEEIHVEVVRHGQIIKDGWLNLWVKVT